MSKLKENIKEKLDRRFLIDCTLQHLKLALDEGTSECVVAALYHSFMMNRIKEAVKAMNTLQQCGIAVKHSSFNEIEQSILDRYTIMK